jgi:hypothetical protein
MPPLSPRPCAECGQPLEAEPHYYLDGQRVCRACYMDDLNPLATPAPVATPEAAPEPEPESMYHCPRCGRTDSPESLYNPGECLNCAYFPENPAPLTEAEAWGSDEPVGYLDELDTDDAMAAAPAQPEPFSPLAPRPFSQAARRSYRLGLDIHIGFLHAINAAPWLRPQRRRHAAVACGAAELRRAHNRRVNRVYVALELWFPVRRESEVA